MTRSKHWIDSVAALFRQPLFAPNVTILLTHNIPGPAAYKSALPRGHLHVAPNRSQRLPALSPSSATPRSYIPTSQHGPPQPPTIETSTPRSPRLADDAHSDT